MEAGEEEEALGAVDGRSTDLYDFRAFSSSICLVVLRLEAGACDRRRERRDRSVQADLWEEDGGDEHAMHETEGPVRDDGMQVRQTPREAACHVSTHRM